MNSAAHRRASLACGLVLFLLSALSGLVPATPCGGLPKRYPPMIAFELARTPADLHDVFGDPGPCRDAAVARLRLINVLDGLLFIPAYGGFLVFAFLGARSKGRLATAAAALAGAACLADYAENACLFRLLADLGDGTALALLPWATMTKWLGLGAATALGGVLLWRAGRRAAAPAAFLGLAAAALCAAAPSVGGPLVVPALGAGWAAFLVFDPGK